MQRAEQVAACARAVSTEIELMTTSVAPERHGVDRPLGTEQDRVADLAGAQHADDDLRPLDRGTRGGCDMHAR